MDQDHSINRQLREAAIDIKRALQGIHEGPGAMPRNRVFPRLGIGPDLYSRWLNTEEPDRLPTLMMFLGIGNISDNPEPLAALARNWGSGYRVVPLAADPADPKLSQQILANHAGPSGTLSAELSHALSDDGIIDAEEAARALPLARANMLASARTVEHLQRLARGRE